MARTTLNVEQLIDPTEVTVVVTRGPDGEVVAAEFDLSALPRVEHILLGTDVAAVPDVVKRLCGICPATHHLAGVRALEALAVQPPVLSPRAQAQRQLLHHASVVDALALKWVQTDRQLALGLRRLSVDTRSACGSPGHFPDLAIPGGVRTPPDLPAVAAVRAEAATLIDGLRPPASEPAVSDSFAGADVALVDAAGQLDGLGEFVAVHCDGRCELFPVAQWWERVRETRPDDTASKPELLCDGRWRSYRVGPVAQLRVQRQDGHSVSAAEAHHAALVRALEGIIAAAALLEAAPDSADAYGTFAGAELAMASGQGIGVVDGPRGILVHSYTADAEQKLSACVIMTPTAQNEPWLAAMLQQEIAAGAPQVLVEEAIRAADPCLPCTAAPTGQMGVQVIDEVVE